MSHGWGSGYHGRDVCKCRHSDWPPSQPQGTWWLIAWVKALNMSKTAINLTLTINTTTERQANNGVYGHCQIKGYDPVVSVFWEKYSYIDARWRRITHNFAMGQHLFTKNCDVKDRHSNLSWKSFSSLLLRLNKLRTCLSPFSHKDHKKISLKKQRCLKKHLSHRKPLAKVPFSCVGGFCVKLKVWMTTSV